MNRSVCKEWPDAIEGSPESPWSQSHRFIYRSRSRSPPERRWGGRTSGELEQPLQNFAPRRWIRDALPDPQRDYQVTLQRHDFGDGKWNGSVGWPYFNCYSASHGMHSDEIRERSGSRCLLDSANGRRPEKQKTKDIPCKFYAKGQCRHGLKCRYLHDSALQTETGLGAPVAASVHSNAHSWYPHHNNVPQNQMLPTAPVVVHTSAHVLFGYERGNLNSQGTFRLDTRDEHNGLQLNFSQTSQNNVFPSNDFGSELPRLFPNQTSENGIYIDKWQSSHETTGILGGPTHLAATHLPNSTALWQWNSQMHQNNFLVHPEKQGDAVDPQAGVNVVSAVSLQRQSFSQEAIPIPDLSSCNGHSFNLNGQVLQNLEAAAHAVERKETTGMPKLGQDSGTQSKQNRIANVQTQRQTLQEVSVLLNSRASDRVGASIYHNAEASEKAHIIDPGLVPSNGEAILNGRPVGTSVSQRKKDPRLVSKTSAAPPSVPPIQQEAAAISVPSDHKIHTIKMETMDDNTSPEAFSNSVDVPPSVPPIQQEAAAISVPSDNKIHTIKMETMNDNTSPEAFSNSVQVTGNAAAWKTFRFALADFVKEQLKKTWKSGLLTREVHKLIVQNVVKEVISSVRTILNTKEDAKKYLHDHRGRINKLTKDYLNQHDVEFVE